ncbi:hypothetical protein CROQUDRAFT_300333 [Cronartium quercuum f. sp. fusiforme G11]|uniref:phosphatidylinositol-3,4,5-trisphosphate 3-phosphatase n=1 Tax=Cronartium quercuum f. sp. fusiforme G11 TaxID=708437 RepID=A0A9P6NQ10_9BASI|nr:hypothetical protein CROQUDRAFT_300333 [Cronartium quercuum f. sp. fusiforme G11]
MNFDSIRRIVSGKKSRLADHEIGVDLDLCYITDKIIVMGYPATGIESLYRNRRKDVRRWLEARHGTFYKIYNFCPRRENEYDPSYFHNQVKRFPFPDHHAPPLSIIPLFVHDITCFLNSSDKNVAVIHCKAGKGRSGTMTVCYLMTLASLPQPPIFKDLYIKSIKQLEEHDQYSQHVPQLPPLSSIEHLSIENQSSNHQSKTEDCKTIDFVSNSPPLDTSIHESSATNPTTTESEGTMVRDNDHTVTQEELATNESLSSESV